MRRVRSLVFSSALCGLLCFTPACSSPEEAADETATASSSEATSDGPTMNDGLAKLRAGDPAGAEEVLEEVVAADSTNGRALFLLGYAERSQEKWDEAAESFQRAVEADPTQRQAKYELARISVRQGEMDAAMAALEELRAEGKYNFSQVMIDSQLAPLRESDEYAARFALLPPTAEEIDDPFVEKTKIIHEWRGETAGDEYGWIAREIGDVDGDGVRDLTTSAPGSVPIRPTPRTTGTEARSTPIRERAASCCGRRSGEAGGSSARGIEAAGDVDGDGVPDVVAGAREPTGCYVYAAATARSSWSSGRGGRVFRRESRRTSATSTATATTTCWWARRATTGRRGRRPRRASTPARTARSSSSGSAKRPATPGLVGSRSG